MSFVLSNKKGESASVPLSQAKSLFLMLGNVDALINVLHEIVPNASATAETTTATNAATKKAKADASAAAPATTADEVDDVDVGSRAYAQVQQGANGDMLITNLDYSIEVLNAMAQYAKRSPSQRTTSLQVPLTSTVDKAITSCELTMLREAESKGFLPQLLDAAAYVRFDTLVKVTAAYCSMRIDEIAKAAPNIMAGAEQIRTFLQMDNGWTPEEVQHLTDEMAYVKEVCKEAY